MIFKNKSKTSNYKNVTDCNLKNWYILDDKNFFAHKCIKI
jgi:hypothetical protein